VIRLWNRVGIFRSLSITVLVLGLAGGFLLADRESQDDLTSTTTSVASGADDVHQVQQDAADQKDAQDKANEMAAIDGQRAKAAEDKARADQAASRSDNRSAKPTTPGVNAGPVPASCASYTGNKAIGCTLLVKAGFGLDQMPCLDKLFTKESHWNTTARNPNGAYGIPQAYPGNKMAVYGSDWQTNPATQITWGLAYIKGKYRTPCGAWANSQAKGYY
jgi:hypothetical protein